MCLGSNCAFGPFELTETVRYIAENWPRLVSALPNAGLPIMVDGKSAFPDEPAGLHQGDDALRRRVRREHRRRLLRHDARASEDARATRSARIGSRKPRDVVVKPQVSSLISAEDIRQDNSYLIVAERTNTNGSRQFKRLLQAEDWDGLVSHGPRRECATARTCSTSASISSAATACATCTKSSGDTSTSARRAAHARQHQPRRAWKPGLKLAGGRCILNSMNLEDGEEKLAAYLRAGEEIRRGGRRRHDRRRQAQRDGPHRASGRSRSPSASATWR